MSAGQPSRPPLLIGDCDDDRVGVASQDKKSKGRIVVFGTDVQYFIEGSRGKSNAHRNIRKCW